MILSVLKSKENKLGKPYLPHQECSNSICLSFLIPLSVIDTTYADTDKDGSITIKDATMIQKYICGLVTTF